MGVSVMKMIYVSTSARNVKNTVAPYAIVRVVMPRHIIRMGFHIIGHGGCIVFILHPIMLDAVDIEK